MVNVSGRVVREPSAQKRRQDTKNGLVGRAGGGSAPVGRGACQSGGRQALAADRGSVSRRYDTGRCPAGAPHRSGKRGVGGYDRGLSPVASLFVHAYFDGWDDTMTLPPCSDTRRCLAVPSGADTPTAAARHQLAEFPLSFGALSNISSLHARVPTGTGSRSSSARTAGSSVRSTAATFSSR